MEVPTHVNQEVPTTTPAPELNEVAPALDAKSSSAEKENEKVVVNSMMTAPSADVLKSRTKAPAAPVETDEKVSLADEPSAGDPLNETDEDDDVPPQVEEDEEFQLAMELAIAAAQNPHLSPAEIQQLVGDKNKQKAMVDEVTKQKEIEEAEQRKREAANGWWATAAKKAEQMKDRAERRLYAETIRKDKEVIEKRKAIRVLRKTLKAHRLQGNRVETRHAFKRQRMEKKLFLVVEKLTKTQKLFTEGNYNVQEYLKAMMRSSKKWRKKGTDEELMLEAQLCRNMHQMLALEKQKVKCKKNTKEMKKYLQRCKGWLSDKEAFCEMNLMTLEATQSSIVFLLEETLSRQDDLIEKLKASEEFQDVDLEDVDLSNVKLPSFSLFQATVTPKEDPMRGLPITDSIKVKRDHEGKMTLEEREAQIRAFEQAQTRNELVKKYYNAKAGSAAPEIYVETKDDISVSSRLSDPDASGNGEEMDMDMNDSESVIKFGKDVPWNAGVSLDSEDKEDVQGPDAARQMIQQMEQVDTTNPTKTMDEPGSDTESPTASTGKSALKEAVHTERAATEATVN